MPIYVYGCDTCGHRFEKFQKFQDAPLSECPECGARIRKILQPAGIVFKGSGWYSTDSRAGRSGSATSPTDGDKSTTAPSADAKSSASNGDGAPKPAEKSETAAKKSAAPTGAAE